VSLSVCIGQRCRLSVYLASMCSMTRSRSSPQPSLSNKNTTRFDKVPKRKQYLYQRWKSARHEIGRPSTMGPSDTLHLLPGFSMAAQRFVRSATFQTHRSITTTAVMVGTERHPVIFPLSSREHLSNKPWRHRWTPGHAARPRCSPVGMVHRRSVG
jgi:hypothetical protein